MYTYMYTASEFLPKHSTLHFELFILFYFNVAQKTPNPCAGGIIQVGCLSPSLLITLTLSLAVCTSSVISSMHKWWCTLPACYVSERVEVSPHGLSGERLTRRTGVHACWICVWSDQVLWEQTLIGPVSGTLQYNQFSCTDQLGVNNSS